jgi:hypothetical protein
MIFLIEKCRKEVSGFWENAPPFAGLTEYTYLYVTKWIDR